MYVRVRARVRARVRGRVRVRVRSGSGLGLRLGLGLGLLGVWRRPHTEQELKVLLERSGRRARLGAICVGLGLGF